MISIFVGDGGATWRTFIKYIFVFVHHFFHFKMTTWRELMSNFFKCFVLCFRYEKESENDETDQQYDENQEGVFVGSLLKNREKQFAELVI